jgi:nicotinamide-nucleotide amidase
MQDLLPIAEKIGNILKTKRATIGVAESSSGGLISAALLAVPGASAYFLGGAVVYTLQSRRLLLDLPDSAFAGLHGLTEELARVLARGARQRFATTWSISEIGVAGPTGSRYGDPPGISCIAVTGPIERTLTVRTGNSDRVANMRAFTAKALELLSECVASAPPAEMT